jgi:hypothetical protein
MEAELQTMGIGGRTAETGAGPDTFDFIVRHAQKLLGKMTIVP